MAGQVDEGLALYEEAIEVCSSYGPAFYNVGVVYSETKEVILACTDSALMSI